MAQEQTETSTPLGVPLGATVPAEAIIPLVEEGLIDVYAIAKRSKKKPGKETDVEDIVLRNGLVLFTDGGAAPTNPGPAGWGIHGYFFNAVKPKKGSGNSDHVLTTQGYVLKSDYNKQDVREIKQADWDAIVAGKGSRIFEVSPVHYVDGYGTFTTEVSNNVAELLAATRALEYAAEYDVKLVQIMLDSKYVQEGIEQWINGWKRNGWVKRDGMPVANVTEWKALQASREALENKGVRVNFIWVRGHNDHLGNETADHLATVGVHIAQRHLRNPDSGQTLSQLINTPADGYWKYVPEKNPLIMHRWMYYNTDLAFARPGQYFLGNEGKDQELLGKRVSSGAYAVVILKHPDPILEMIRNHQAALARGTNTIAEAKLDEVFRPETHRELVNYGTAAIRHPNPYRLDLTTLAKKPLTHEFNPARLCMRAVDAVGELYRWLNEYEAGDTKYIETDLTSILYEQSVKMKMLRKGQPVDPEPEVKYTLYPQYDVGYASLQVDANYQVSDGTQTAPVILILGCDLPDRNTLKRLEDQKPKITLISWMEAEKVFRYATVIQAGEDKAIYAGYYANVRVLNT